MSRQTSRSLAWSHGVVSVQTLGAMLGPTVFVLPDGRQIAPFHIAPWFDDPAAGELPGVLRRLRGEWPCVPFGAATDRAAAGGWPASSADHEPDRFPHGYGSNHDWHWLNGADDELALAIEYPAAHPIARLERRIGPVAGRAAIAIELTVIPRADCVLPIGLHPVFRLSPKPGSMRLEAEAASARTFPGNVDPSALFAPDQMVGNWHDVRTRNGNRINPSHLPLGEPTEDLLQLVNAEGTATLHNLVEDYRVRLSWDPRDFPHLLLWFSNRGRAFAPWNGRHLALGVEPVCSAFDLGTQISSAPNPISRSGAATAHAFRAGQSFVTSYKVSVDGGTQPGAA